MVRVWCCHIASVVSSASLINFEIGETEYNWIGPTLPTGDDTTPRSHVDHLAQGVQGMHIGPAGYPEQQQYAYPTQQGDLQTASVGYPQHPQQPQLATPDTIGGDTISTP